MTRFERIAGIYKTAAILAFNTVVFVVALNLALWIVFAAKDAWMSRHPVPVGNPVAQRYGEDAVRQVYPDLPDKVVDELLNDTWGRRLYQFEAYTQHKERPYRSKYLNVDENGFRASRNQGPWPPDSANFNVFVFGGSTTFGYGLPDDQTMPSRLQEFLGQSGDGRPVRVYNFARGDYFSTQESILFQGLLRKGCVPNVAVFVDGLNDFRSYQGIPGYSQLLADFMDDKPQVSTAPSWSSKLPMARAARLVNRLVTGHTVTAAAPAPEPGPDPADASVSAQVIQRYVGNKRDLEAIAAAFGIGAAFVWQPVPTYRYNLKYHLFADGGFGVHAYSQYGYPRMAEYVREHPMGGDFQWCADLQEGLDKPLYVDKVHYTAEFAKRLAETIGQRLKERGLLGAGGRASASPEGSHP